MNWSSISSRSVCELLASAAASPVAALAIGALFFLLATVNTAFPWRCARISHRVGVNYPGYCVVDWRRCVLEKPTSANAMLLPCPIWGSPVLSIRITSVHRKSFARGFVLAVLALSVELVAIALMWRLPRLFRTALSTSYHIALTSLILGLFCYNLRFNAPISDETIVALLQTTLIRGA